MRGPFAPFSKLMRRWSNQQLAALHALTERKTVGQRLAGYTKSERVDANFLLLALVPFVPLMISDQVGWSRSLLWEGWFWLSVIWAAIVVGIGLASYWRALRRSLGRKR
jgi:hypothetical protein